VARALTDAEDAFGHLLLDFLDGRRGQPLLERDDGHVGSALGPEVFFSERGTWPAEEQDVFEAVSGRVLDVGAGAGRHALSAERHGFEVLAIDISPGALEVCNRRGVRDARLLALEDVGPELGEFDTVLMMCGNFGLVGDRERALDTLRRLAGLTSSKARIVLDTVDPYVDADGSDAAYAVRNRERGRMPGQVTIRIRYGERVTPWYDLLNVSAQELAELAEETRWHVELVREDPPDIYAVLAKSARTACGRGRALPRRARRPRARSTGSPRTR